MKQDIIYELKITSLCDIINDAYKNVAGNLLEMFNYSNLEYQALGVMCKREKEILF